MVRRYAGWLVLALTLWNNVAWADDPPAVAAAAASYKDTLRGIITAAKTEGAVAYWDAVISPETNQHLTAAFHAAYGLPDSFAVKYTQSATLNLVTHVDQEVDSGNVTTDVASLASPPWLNGLVAHHHILHYDSPEQVHYARAIASGLAMAGYYVPNGAYFFTPCWNADNLDFKGTTWKDILEAVPPGRISTNDAAHSATGLLNYIGLRQHLGLDYFKSFAKMKPRFIVRTEQMTEALVTGQDLMAFGDTTGRLMQSNAKGANLKFLIPKDGVVLLGAGSFILARAPHPNAAKLWIDFTLSETGQAILSKEEGLTSVRSGFVSPLPDYAPAIDALTVISVDWTEVTDDDIKAARTEWQTILSP